MPLRVTLIPCRRFALLRAIRVAFEGDALLNKYHIAPSEYCFDMAKHTWREIQNSLSENPLIRYAVYLEKEIIGFTVICKDPIHILYSFGINPKHRTKDTLMKWLDSVSLAFGCDDYVVTLNQKNTRAINFFQRNGFSPQAIDKNSKTIALCHYSEAFQPQ